MTGLPDDVAVLCDVERIEQVITRLRKIVSYWDDRSERKRDVLAVCDAHDRLFDVAASVVRFWNSHGAWGDFASLTTAAGEFQPVAHKALDALNLIGLDADADIAALAALQPQQGSLKPAEDVEPLGALLICDQTGGRMWTCWPVPHMKKQHADSIYGDTGGYRTVPLYAAPSPSTPSGEASTGDEDAAVRAVEATGYLAGDEARDVARAVLRATLSPSIGDVDRMREALEPFASQILADPDTASGWRIGYLPTLEDQKKAHIAYFGKPTTLASLNGRKGSEVLSADEMEDHPRGAPWNGRQPIEDLAKDWKGRQWVPLEAAISELQFWQRRDYENAIALAALNSRKDGK